MEKPQVERGRDGVDTPATHVLECCKNEENYRVIESDRRACQACKSDIRAGLVLIRLRGRRRISKYVHLRSAIQPGRVEPSAGKRCVLRVQLADN